MEVLQIKNKIPRRKALSSLEDKVLSILTENGYITKTEAVGSTEMTLELVEDEEEDEEVVVDGEVDEGDVHIKPVSRKPIPLVGFSFSYFRSQCASHLFSFLRSSMQILHAFLCILYF